MELPLVNSLPLASPAEPAASHWSQHLPVKGQQQRHWQDEGQTETIMSQETHSGVRAIFPSLSSTRKATTAPCVKHRHSDRKLSCRPWDQTEASTQPLFAASLPCCQTVPDTVLRRAEERSFRLVW